MRYVACSNEECINKGAPYHLTEDDTGSFACPVCGRAMETCTPDLSPPKAVAVEVSVYVPPDVLVPPPTLEQRLVDALDQLNPKTASSEDVIAAIKGAATATDAVAAASTPAKS